MIMVNVVSLVSLTHLFAADMVKQGGGRILNVGSTAGFMPVSVTCVVSPVVQCASACIVSYAILPSRLLKGPESSRLFRHESIRKLFFSSSRSRIA